MALPRITQKEMTEREQRELKTLLDRARRLALSVICPAFQHKSVLLRSRQLYSAK